MTGTEQIEIERKYDVDDGAVVPDLVGVGAGGGAGRALEVARVVLDPAASLSATYHDTPDHRLLGARVTLRRRTGGHDAGWHLKLPPEVAGGGRREVHHPLGADDEPVPAALLDRVAALLATGRDGGGDGDGDGASALRPVLLLETRRTAHHLLDGEGRELVEVADDVVRATRVADGRVRAWREWEAELGRGVDGPEGDALLDALAPRLRAAGARPSAHRSKLALGLGD